METLQPPITMSVAKKKRVYRTSVLAPYEGCSMFLLHRGGTDNEPRYVYRVEKDDVTVVFKATTCFNSNKESVRQIKEEFYLCKRAYESARDGVVKPISCEEIEDKKMGRFYFEAVYEYGGENLLIALKNSDAEEIMNVMAGFANTMALLESKHIFHSDIKPANIVISSGVVKVLDFGVAMSFDHKTSMFTTKDLKGATLLYLAPEILEGKSSEPTAVDVYAWGITLYQLLTGRTENELIDDLDTRRKDHKTFLKNAMNLKIKRDPSGAVKNKAMDILPKVLDYEPKKRPTFSMINAMFMSEESCKNELEKANQKLSQVIKERDEHKKKIQNLLDEHNKCSAIHKDLKV